MVQNCQTRRKTDISVLVPASHYLSLEHIPRAHCVHEVTCYSLAMYTAILC